MDNAGAELQRAHELVTILFETGVSGLIVFHILLYRLIDIP